METCKWQNVTMEFNYRMNKNIIVYQDDTKEKLLMCYSHSCEYIYECVIPTRIQPGGLIIKVTF